MRILQPIPPIHPSGYLFLSIFLLLLAGCTKSDDGLSKKICLTFEGDLINHFDDVPVADEYVYVERL